MAIRHEKDTGIPLMDAGEPANCDGSLSTRMEVRSAGKGPPRRSPRRGSICLPNLLKIQWVMPLDAGCPDSGHPPIFHHSGTPSGQPHLRLIQP